jgi:hypothetical protein
VAHIFHGEVKANLLKKPFLAYAEWHAHGSLRDFGDTTVSSAYNTRGLLPLITMKEQVALKLKLH